MVATATVFSWNAGSDGTPTKAATPAGPPDFRYKDADENDIGATNKVQIPTSGDKFSRWKHAGLRFTVTPFSITNIDAFTDGANAWTLGTGGEWRRGNRDAGIDGVEEADYDVSDGAGTSDIEEVTNGHGFFNGQTTKTTLLTADTSGAQADIDDTTYTTVNDDSNTICTQVKVNTNATQGEQTDETTTFEYDES